MLPGHARLVASQVTAKGTRCRFFHCYLDSKLPGSLVLSSFITDYLLVPGYETDHQSPNFVGNNEMKTVF